MHGQDHLVFDDLHAELKQQADDAKVLTLDIKSGTLELKDNKAIILAD